MSVRYVVAILCCVPSTKTYGLKTVTIFIMPHGVVGEELGQDSAVPLFCPLFWCSLTLPGGKQLVDGLKWRVQAFSAHESGTSVGTARRPGSVGTVDWKM